MTRRELLGAAAAPLAAVPLRAADDTLTVRDIEVHVVHVNQRGNWILTRVVAANGLRGIGDASHGGEDAVKLRHLKTFSDLLRGRRVHDIEAFRQAAAPEIARGGTAAAIAFSALEMSLWDIIGKQSGMPVYDLFGGVVRKRIRNYANINRSTPVRNPEGFGRMAAAAAEAGFDAVKLAPFDDMARNPTPQQREEATEHGIACIAAVRDAIGPKRDLLVDAHSRFDLQTGLELVKRLEAYNLFWIEEVCRSYEDLAVINRKVKTTTAGGEAIFGLAGFLPYVQAKAVDIAMPDVKYCGGMLELKKIASLCEAADMQVSPHGPASPVGNIAAAHVCATMANFLILELSFGEVPWRADLITPAETLVNGFHEVSAAPGLGIELNDRELARRRIDV